MGCAERQAGGLGGAILCQKKGADELGVGL